MSKAMFHWVPRSLVYSFCFVLACALSVSPTIAQDSNLSGTSQPKMSRAEKQAEEMVALSAEKVIEILHAEPGLLLQVKKMLVRKAYEQGRLLDPADLTDEALYDLIRDDYNIRALATREIEDRYYIRAKPTREELEQGKYREREGAANPAQPPGTAVAAANQEDQYWQTHELAPRVRRRAPATGRETYPPGTYPPEAYPPTERAPEVRPSPDRRRQLERAQAETPTESYPAEGGRLTQIHPEELPQLLAAEAPQASLPRFGEQRQPSILPPSEAMPPGGMTAQPTERFPTRQPESATEARLERGSEAQWPPYRQLERQRQTIIRHRPNPYANVPSLYDLYQQVARRSATPERFGADIFRTGTGNFDDLPMDLPVGPEYVLGPGDGLTIDLWGSVSQRLQRYVDREGRVSLPEVGTVLVAGRNLGDVQHEIQTVLRTQFRDVSADVSLSRLRTVRVYVVGDVQRPGAYDISSLSTPLNAVYAAGGPTSGGSLRTLKQYRGKELVQDIDVYDLILHGVRSGVKGIQPGDTVLVPPIGPQVTIEGMVRRPAIYELRGEANLAEALELAGGVLSTGTLRHIEVERVVAHEKRVMLNLDLPENNDQQAVTKALEDFKVQDGDMIKIAPILPYAYKTVYLDGHVFRPGKYPYTEGMKLTDLIKSYSDLLPEPSQRHAEIIRLKPPDFTPVVLSFNLGDALSGKGVVPALEPFDTVRIFGRYDFEDAPEVTVTGEVRTPGEQLTNGVTHLRDAIYLAGGVTPDALLTDVQIYRKEPDGELKVISANLGKALAGDPVENVLLEARDRIIVHRNLAKVDPSTVIIEGEVARPGKYPLGENMTAAQLVRLAGGLKRGAYTDSADLLRYVVESGTRVLTEQQEVPIAKALAGVPDSDVRLRDGDVLSIRQLSGWTDVGSTIAVKGEVTHPGTYGIQAGERLSSILRRAGGFRSTAYPYGAVLLRASVREIERRNMAEIIRRVEGEKANLKVAPETQPEQKQAKEAALQQWEMTLQKLRSTPPTGRMVIHIGRDIKRWQNTPSDIEVRAGDTLVIPKEPNYVSVQGQVYNPTAVSFRPGKSAKWYLSQAGGPTQLADKKAIFVIRADGSVISSHSGGGWFLGSPLSASLHAGDTVVVPEKAIKISQTWKNVLQTAQIFSSVAVSAAVVLK